MCAEKVANFTVNTEAYFAGNKSLRALKQSTEIIEIFLVTLTCIHTAWGRFLKVLFKNSQFSILLDDGLH